MFHNFTELIMEIPSPASINGVALLSEELMLFMLPTDSRSISEKTSIGFWPWTKRIIEPIVIPTESPIKKE
mgnify:CR=1 FL=1